MKKPTMLFLLLCQIALAATASAVQMFDFDAQAILSDDPGCPSPQSNRPRRSLADEVLDGELPPGAQRGDDREKGDFWHPGMLCCPRRNRTGRKADGVVGTHSDSLSARDG